MNRLLRSAALALPVMLVMALPSIAHADSVDTTPDDEIAYALAAEPGGYATSEHTAYWPDLDMTLVSSQEEDESGVGALKAVGLCANGKVCAFSRTAGTGSKLSWSSCGSHSTSAIPTVRSIANGRSAGTLKARNGSSVVATAAAGKQANVSKKVTNIYC